MWPRLRSSTQGLAEFGLLSNFFFFLTAIPAYEAVGVPSIIDQIQGWKQKCTVGTVYLWPHTEKLLSANSVCKIRQGKFVIPIQLGLQIKNKKMDIFCKSLLSPNIYKHSCCCCVSWAKMTTLCYAQLCQPWPQLSSALFTASVMENWPPPYTGSTSKPVWVHTRQVSFFFFSKVNIWFGGIRWD